MQVKSIAECSKGSTLQYLRHSLSYHLSLRFLFCLFLCGHFTQSFSTNRNQPVHKIFVLVAYAWCHFLNMPAQLSRGTRDLNICMCLHLHLIQYFVCVSFKGSGEIVDAYLSEPLLLSLAKSTKILCDGLENAGCI